MSEAAYLAVIFLVDLLEPEEGLDVIAGTLTPVTGMLPAYIIEIIIAFLIEVAVTLVLKKLPVFPEIVVGKIGIGCLEQKVYRG